MFHVGHLRLLKRARRACDYLVVGISTDELIEEVKGKRPVIPFEQRWEIIEALGIADEIIPQTTLEKFIMQKETDFDVIFVGCDHQPDWDVRYEELKVRYFPYTSEVSTTKIIKRINDS